MASRPLYNEQELLAEIAKGDQRAFTTLFNHYQRDLFLFSKSLVKSDDAAIEAVQDVFLKIWTRRAELLTIENFAAYLNRIVRNHSLNLLRKMSRELTTGSWRKVEAEEDHFPLVDQATHQQLDYNDAIRVLEMALAELPAQQRKVYELCHKQGLRYEEAAKVLGISIETVRVHMKRALQRIRWHFRKHAILYPLLIIALSR